MRTTRWVLLILITASLSLGSVHAQTETSASAPYLYYFSNFLNAWVIERADGSDSHILGQGLMREETNTAYGEWSPSGEWFAWKTEPLSSNWGRSSPAWIISADGSKRITTLDGFPGVHQLLWSPTADLLFALVRPMEVGKQPHFYLIDAANDKVIASSPFPAFHIFDEDVRNGVWSPDGSSVSFQYIEYHSDEDTEHPVHVVTIDADDGHITDEVVPYDFYSVQSGAYRWEIRETPVRRTLIFRVPATGELTESFSVPDHIDAFEWSPDGTKALIASDKPCEGAQYCSNLWLLALSATTGDYYTLTGITGDFYPYRDYSVNAVISHWSPDGKYAWFITTHGELYLLNAETRTAEALELEDKPSVAYWSPDSRYLVVKDTSLEWLTMIDVNTRSSQRFGWLQLLHTTNLQPVPLEVSPDNQYIALGNQPGVIVVPYGDIRPLIQHSAATYGGYEIYSYWHPSSQWLISEQIVFFAGGRGGEPRAAIVTRPDGSEHRELTQSLGTIGWLPDRVVPHLGTPLSTFAIQQPTASLRHDGNVVALAWSPDGQQLAAISSSPGYGRDLKIWSMGEQDIQLIHDVNLSVGYAENMYPVSTFLWSPDGRQIAYHSTLDVPSYVILDVETGHPVDIVLGNIFRWLPDGSYEITSTLDNSPMMSTDSKIFARSAIYLDEINLFDSASNEQVGRINWSAKALDFSPDGRWLAAGNTQLVTIWDVNEALERDQ